jgi:hypothetical protein
LTAAAASRNAIVLGLVSLMLATIVSAQQPTRHSARDVRLRIETDQAAGGVRDTTQAAYRTGDSIAVRLTLLNSSSQDLKIFPTGHTGLAKLVVYDASGHKVEPTVSPARLFWSSGPPRILKPQAEMTVRGQKGEWLKLRDWGYDLRSSGKYTIVGIPLVGGPNVETDAKTVRSHEATFTIEP